MTNRDEMELNQVKTGRSCIPFTLLSFFCQWGKNCMERLFFCQLPTQSFRMLVFFRIFFLITFFTFELMNHKNFLSTLASLMCQLMHSMYGCKLVRWSRNRNFQKFWCFGCFDAVWLHCMPFETHQTTKTDGYHTYKPIRSHRISWCHFLTDRCI